MEGKIIKYIKTEHDPEVILLAGSRAKGKETSGSDWDIFLLGPKKGNGGFIDFEGERLDITFKNWPDEDKPLTIPSGPLWPLKILLDNSEGKLSKVLTKTEEDFSKGPLTLYKNGVLERFEKLDSWKLKIEKYCDNPMVEFFYAGVFYEFAIRAWFELQDKWSLAPVEAIRVIKLEDKDFYELLNSFTTSISAERIKFTKQILDRLNNLK
ncbi:MAG: nucleotidyltransferase domain-containing protein [Candidatus Zambryskibacteria bacterium]|nr:nucleotidyltransferase domain-containing protein [Candidatus Zambryskibacteria bacterium]